MKKINLFFLLCIGLVSCVRENIVDPNQNRIFAVYELSYNRNTATTYAIATFKLSSDTGARKKLSSVSEIKFANADIPFDTAAIEYRREFSSLVTLGTFYYRDSVKNVFTNKLELVAKIDNPLVETIDRADGAFELDWVGDSIVANTYVKVTLYNVADPTLRKTFIQSNLGAGSLVMGLDQLNDLPSGPAVIHTERIFEKAAASVTPSGGLIRSKYTAPDRRVVIR